MYSPFLQRTLYSVTQLTDVTQRTQLTRRPLLFLCFGCYVSCVRCSFLAFIAFVTYFFAYLALDGSLACLFAIGYTRPVFKHDEGGRNLSKEDLARQICLKLSETETLSILDMPSICVMSDSDEALEIVRRNELFELVHIM